MKRGGALLALAAGALLAGDGAIPVTLRGRTLTVTRLKSGGTPAAAVIFLAGDGGWRGAAAAMGRTIATWGYDVYGFDTKAYLEACSEGGAKLSQQELASDLRGLAGEVAGISKRRVILAGWSQGAGMAVAAAAGGLERGGPIAGIVTLGLPEEAVLGWDWKATLAALARRAPDQPGFAVRPLLERVAPIPVWMIYGTKDEYTRAETERGLYEAAGEPKRLEVIAGANHRFEGHEGELYRSLRRGLEWIVSS